MKGSEAVIEELNKNLKGELTAINQYLAHAGFLQNQGYTKLSKKLKEIANQEREHSEELIDRVMFLHGGLTQYRPDQSSTPEEVKTMLSDNLALERQAFDDYNRASGIAVSNGDNGSRDLFSHILGEEEQHIKFFESQLTQIRQMGLENYLASQV